MKPSKIFDTPQASGFDMVESENKIDEIDEILGEFIKYAHEPDCIYKLRTTLHQELQKAREERDEIWRKEINQFAEKYGLKERWLTSEDVQNIYNHSELDQDKK